MGAASESIATTNRTRCMGRVAIAPRVLGRCIRQKTRQKMESVGVQKPRVYVAGTNALDVSRRGCNIRLFANRPERTLSP